MPRVCHRCHAELPGDGRTAAERYGVYGSAADDEEHALFCPRCGAPQLVLPDYMRSETAGSAASTTGAVPPPRPQLVDWRVALGCVAPVAGLTAALAVAGLVAPVASFLNTLCVLGGSGIVLALYRTRRPLARIDGRVGLRVGLLTGFLMVVGMGLALSLTGLIERFGVHGMASFDAELAQQFALMQAQMMDRLQAQEQGREMQQRVIGFLSSPEVRAGLGLFYLAVMAGFVMTLTTAAGGFAGLLQTRRRSPGRGK